MGPLFVACRNIKINQTNVVRKYPVQSVRDSRHKSSMEKAKLVSAGLEFASLFAYCW